jgi:hypothetical protein
MYTIKFWAWIDGTRKYRNMVFNIILTRNNNPPYEKAIVTGKKLYQAEVNILSNAA